jgi:peptidoglycan/LPS O-acetylase OafA/YrhL
MWILFSISLLYIIQYQFFDFRLQIDGIPFLRGDYHFLFIPYSAFLVLLAINFIPKQRKNKVTKIISTIGKSTYHILLVQILYFAVLIAIYRDNYGASILGVATDDLNVFLNFVINLSICVPIGVIWWSIENSIRSYRLNKKEIS